MQKITFYDTETTGLPDWKVPSDSEHQPHLVQLAAIQCDNETREVLNQFDVIIKPDGWEISQEMTDIHGISQERALKEGIEETEAVKMLLNLCDSAIRVAHNRTFDQRIIRIALKRYHCFSDEIMDKWADKEDHECTMLSAARIMRIPPRGKYGWKWPKLEQALEFFCSEKLGDSAHNAMIDAEACMKIYWGLQDYDDLKSENAEMKHNPESFDNDILSTNEPF